MCQTIDEFKPFCIQSRGKTFKFIEKVEGNQGADIGILMLNCITDKAL
jgi:hypothetical protein